MECEGHDAQQHNDQKRKLHIAYQYVRLSRAVTSRVPPSIGSDVLRPIFLQGAHRRERLGIVTEPATLALRHWDQPLLGQIALFATGLFRRELCEILTDTRDYANVPLLNAKVEWTRDWVRAVGNHIKPRRLTEQNMLAAQVQRLGRLGLAERDAALTSLDLDDALYAVFGTQILLRFLDPARGMGDVRTLEADAGTERLQAAA